MYVSRHHPVSSTMPVNQSGASAKWSKKQDQKLRQAVLKYGTQWSIISKKYRFDRSVNSLVKRWHGKLKDETQKVPQNQSSSSSEEEEQQKSQTQKSKKIRKQQKNQQKSQKPKSKRGGYRPRRPKQSEAKQQSRQRSRSQKQPQGDKEEQQNNKKEMSMIEEQHSERQSKENLLGEKDEEIDSLDNSQSKFVFEHKWKELEDKQLKEMILNEHILKWEDLANKLKIENIRQVRKRWQYNVYPEIIEQRKIGGCLKYSQEEDAILSRGVKLGMTVMELRKFLPGRTQYSLEARRRRTLRMDEEKVPEHRYWIKKLMNYKFVDKRHQHLEKPKPDDEFMFRSDSE